MITTTTTAPRLLTSISQEKMRAKQADARFNTSTSKKNQNKKNHNNKRHKWLAFRAIQGAYEDARFVESDRGRLAAHPLAHIGLAMTAVGAVLLCCLNDKPFAESVHLQSIVQAMFCVMAACLYAVYMFMSYVLRLVLAYAESSFFNNNNNNIDGYTRIIRKRMPAYYINSRKGDHKSGYEEVQSTATSRWASAAIEAEEEAMAEHFSDSEDEITFKITDEEDEEDTVSEEDNNTKGEIINDIIYDKDYKQSFFVNDKENNELQSDQAKQQQMRKRVVIASSPVSLRPNLKQNNKKGLPREVIISSMYMGGSGAFLAIAPLCMWDFAITTSFLLSLYMIGIFGLQRQTKKKTAAYCKKTLLVVCLAIVLGTIIAIETVERMPWTLKIITALEKFNYWRNYSDVSSAPNSATNDNNSLKRNENSQELGTLNNNNVDSTTATMMAPMWPLMLLAAASPLLLSAGGGASGFIFILQKNSY